jgi:hypothetical protein
LGLQASRDFENQLPSGILFSIGEHCQDWPKTCQCSVQVRTLDRSKAEVQSKADKEADMEKKTIDQSQIN